MAGIAARVLTSAVRRLFRIFYRLDVVGAENVPESGPGLIVSNHVSYLDAAVISVALRRPVRFVMFRDYFKKPVIGRLARLFDPIPVSSGDSAGGIRQSLDAVFAALKAGELVCLFPEGSMTRTGHLLGFKRGFELIARRAGAPIVPMHLDHLWGSVFSFRDGRFFFKRPKYLRRALTVSIGTPFPPKTSRYTVRQAILDLSADAFARRKRDQQPLHVQFWRAARRNCWRRCMADSTGVTLRWGGALVGALALSRWMRKRAAGQNMIGMMLPASVGAALINAAALIAGKVPVNLNFTSSHASLDAAMKKCDLKTVFTTRALLKKAGLGERVEYVFLEDVIGSVPRRSKILSFILAALTPAFLAERWLMKRGRMDDLATVMFTSGSTGEPKGVMLSHHNVVSNIEAMAEILQFGPADTIMGVLPPFHSFGFTTTLWIPLTQGVRAVFHPNPLDAKGVGRMVEKHGATLIMGTPSFYALYTRGCKPEQFRSLRLAIAGGQKLLPAAAEAFRQRFGLPLSEGYGCTELSPVVAVNIPDVRRGNVFQAGTCEGSVGRPLPGVAVRIADRETLAPVAGDADGIILIKGPNVMQGYLDAPDATADVIRDGWYVTADIGAVDDDGFIHIHDRASRFSKIGGEMVPHAALEDALLRAAEGDERRFVVVALPDVTRGERLAVLYSGPELDASSLLRTAAESGMPNLWLPAARDVFRVDALPLLASGKTDLVTARRLVEEASARARGDA